LAPNFYSDYFGTDEGLVVAAVASGSSASKVGVRAPYLLTHLAGLSVNSMEDVCRILRSHGDGDSLKVEFMHLTETEVQFLEGEIVLGDSTGGMDLEVVHRVIFSEDQNGGDTGGAEVLTVGRWEGVATVTVDYWAPCGANGDWEYYDTQNYTHSTNVIVDVPFDEEFNPYWIEVWSDDETEGGFWFLSSWIWQDGQLGEYWVVDYDGTSVTGELESRPQTDAETGNVVYSFLTNDPCSDAQGGSIVEMRVDNGATMSGVLDSTGGLLEFSGMTADLFRDFYIVIELQRIE
jgi:hypothetical protein